LTITPSTQNTASFLLTSFGFGITNADSSAWYQSLLNSNVDFGLNANIANLALNFRGLGLPANQFRQFNNLLSIITSGEATCLNFPSGYCILT